MFVVSIGKSPGGHDVRPISLIISQLISDLRRSIINKKLTPCSSQSFRDNSNKVRGQGHVPIKRVRGNKNDPARR